MIVADEPPRQVAGSGRRIPEQWRAAIGRAWGRVHSKVSAIILLTGGSTILIALLGVAAINAVARRASADVVEKQVQMMVEVARAIAPAMLASSSGCGSPVESQAERVLAFANQAFPHARAALSVASGTDKPRPPAWLPSGDFAGLVVDQGRVEVRSLAVRRQGDCQMTAEFALPLDAAFAQQISASDAVAMTSVPPRRFHVHPLNRSLLQTIETNFVPGLSRPVSVVFTARNWQTGVREDWIAYQVRPTYYHGFTDVTRLGTQLADWVWLLGAFTLAVFVMNAAGIWTSVRLGSNISSVINDLSHSARQIAAGRFVWRAPVRSNDQLGGLARDFNEMASALERLQMEEAARLRLESELQLAQRVQQYLYPRVAPVLHGANVAGTTTAAHTIGGDLYDFLELGDNCFGILCADVSGKGIAAALMMAYVQAIAHACVSGRPDGQAITPATFVEAVNSQLAGRFEDNRYASLFWAQYNASTGMLSYVNAGHPPPILVRRSGTVERLDAQGLPVGMFRDIEYTANELRLEPGSHLVIFTDGVTDALNLEEEAFGEDRLLEYCRGIGAGADARTVVDTLIESVQSWAAGEAQFDDTTVVVIAAEC